MRLKYGAFLLLLVSVHPAYTTNYAEKPLGYAVSSAHPLATNAGLAILAAGGNAFDAAIAVSAVLAVVEPYHSGLGGGGFWLLYDAKHKRNVFIDGRETAPLAAHQRMFLTQDGQVMTGASLNGGLAAAIPGEPAALVYLAQHYGRLPLAQALAPAIYLAEQGFVVDRQYNYFLTMTDRMQQLQRFPDSAAIFLHHGKAYQIGEIVKQTDLANTLKILAAQGHDGFYRGIIAKRLVKGVRAAGGIWTLADLARYQVKVREPLQGAYHAMLIITAPPPSAGGVALLTMLNILSHYPLASLSKVQWVHYLVEAMRLASWQREDIADPDFVEIPLVQRLSAANGSYLAALITSSKVIDNHLLQGEEVRDHDSNTSHFSILDQQGNRVAATLTLNYIFGSSVVPAGTGVLLNDEMNDFAIQPGIKNVFGISGSVKNLIEPGKRPVSSMAPTFLETPGRVAIVGTPGGSRIPTMVLLAALAFYDYYGAISMVSAMRFHHQHQPDWLQFEPDTFSPWLQNKLSKLGHHLMALKQYYGDMQAITWDKRSNLITAAADPRHMGLAATVTVNQDGYGINH